MPVNGGEKAGHMAAQNQASSGVPSAMARAPQITAVCHGALAHRAIYWAKDAVAGMKALEEFEAGDWGQRYPAIALSWRRNWDHVIPFFAFPESVRRIIYTTDEIEKTFLLVSAIFHRCGRPRGEAWR